MSNDLADQLKKLGFSVSNNPKPSENNRVRTGKMEDAQVSAPYNFVPFANIICDYSEMEGEIPGHNSADPKLHCGEIDVEIVARSSICVGNQIDDEGITRFFRDVNGKYAIQGSSLRGLVRSNAQVLSFSGFSDDIDNYSLMYRDMSTKPLRDEYSVQLGKKTENNVTVLEKVRAGYIRNEKGHYLIYGTKEDDSMTLKKVNYYNISERYMLDKNHYSNFKSLYTEPFISTHKMLYKKGTHFKREQKNDYVHFTADHKFINDDYKPFMQEIRYKSDNEHRVTEIIYDPNNREGKGGILVASGKMQEKKNVYIVPEIDEKKLVCDATEIYGKYIESYQIDYNNKLNTLGENKNFYKLPEEGKTKPVFYFVEGKELYIGFTPYLRLFYKHQILDGLNQQPVKMDYTKALFGYSSDEESRKGRVFFGNCPINDQVSGKIKKKIKKYVLGAPKASSYYDYLVQDDYVSTYNSEEINLRGVKQYWIHDIDQEDESAHENVVSKFEVLPENTSFVGKVHFSNLTSSELGLLIMSIEISDKAVQNIGHGKPYGFGAVQLKIKKIRELDREKAYFSDEFNFDPYEDTTSKREKYVELFKNKMNKWVKDNAREFNYISSPQDYMNTCTIATFMKMKETKLIRSESYRYMKLGDKKRGIKSEYQLRKSKHVPLPTAVEVIERDEKQ